METAGPLAASVSVDRSRGSRPYDRHIFGHAIGHQQSQTYGGVFAPSSPLADGQGFRTDVIAAWRELGVPVLRWPSGDFGADYNWRDGVGPSRGATFNRVTRAVEPNTFGTDEFVALCRALGAVPAIGTNGGIGTPEDATDWVEYCNGVLPTRHARARRLNGTADPHGVVHWAIGAEGPLKSVRSPEAWGAFVAESAKMMRCVDPSLVLSAPVTPDFERTLGLLRGAGETIDMVSLAIAGDIDWPADAAMGYRDAILRTELADAMICRTRQVLGAAGFADRVGIAINGWNLRSRPQADILDAPGACTMADAIFATAVLNTCLRNADLVRMAHIAPSVNGYGPLLVNEDSVLKRTTYHALKLYAECLLSRVADCFVSSDRIGTGAQTVAALDAVATCADADGPLNLMLVNRDAERTLHLTLRVDGHTLEGTYDAIVLAGDSPDACNDFDRPDRVRPLKTRLHFRNGIADLPPHAVINLPLSLPDVGSVVTSVPVRAADSPASEDSNEPASTAPVPAEEGVSAHYFRPGLRALELNKRRKRPAPPKKKRPRLS